MAKLCTKMQTVFFFLKKPTNWLFRIFPLPTFLKIFQKVFITQKWFSYYLNHQFIRCQYNFRTLYISKNDRFIRIFKLAELKEHPVGTCSSFDLVKILLQAAKILSIWSISLYLKLLHGTFNAFP